MKITKTVRYNYKFTESTLEQDIDSFINQASNREYSWDHKYENEALKILKQYFKLLDIEFEKGNYEECKRCYSKLIFFCINASGTDYHENLFDYEDLLSRFTKDFDYYVRRCFISIVKTSDIEELVEKVAEYVMALSIYEFDSDTGVLVKELDQNMIENLEQRLLIKTEIVKKSNRNDKENMKIIDLIYFLFKLAEEQKDKDKIRKYIDRFKTIIQRDDIEEYEEHLKENR